MEPSSELPLLPPAGRAIRNYVVNYCLIFLGVVNFIALIPDYSAILTTILVLMPIAPTCIKFAHHTDSNAMRQKLCCQQILIGALAFPIANILPFYILNWLFSFIPIFRGIALEPFDLPLRTARGIIEHDRNLQRFIDIHDDVTANMIFSGLVMVPVTVQTTLWFFASRVIFLPNLTPQTFVYAFMCTAFGFAICKCNIIRLVPYIETEPAIPPFILIFSYVAFACLMHVATTGILGVAMAKNVFLGRKRITVAVAHWLSAVLLYAVYNALTFMPVIFAIDGIVPLWCVILAIIAQIIIILSVLFVLRAQVQRIAYQHNQHSVQ